MKNVLKTFGIIALVAIIGFSFAACDNGGGGGGGGGNTGGTGGNTGGTGGNTGGTGGTGGGSGGTFTLTGIPAEYNGKYASLIGYPAPDTKDTAYNSVKVRISGGSVSLPMLVLKEGGSNRFSGSDTIDVGVYIGEGTNISLVVVFDSVYFSGGSASRSWGQNNRIEKP